MTATGNSAESFPRTALARISINTIWMYCAWVVRKTSILLLAMVIGRVAGVSDFGVYCLALVWMEAAIRLADFGTDILIVRETSARYSRAAELVGNAMVWRIVAAAAICPVMLFAARRLNHSTLLPDVVAIMAIGMIAQAMGNFYLSLLQGRERVDLHAFAQASTSLFGLILGIVAVVEGYGLQGLALAYSIRGVFCLLLGMGFCRRLGIVIRPRIHLPFMGKMLRSSAPIGINRLMTVFYLGSGMTLLQFIHGETAVGLFAAAMKIFEACSAFGSLTMVAAFPTLARLQAASKDGLRRTTAAIARLFCWAGIPMSLVVALSAKVLLSFFGSGFSSGAAALVILMVAIPFSLNSELAERLAYAHHDQKKVLFIRFVGIALNMLILCVAVGPFGYLAPATAILAAEVLMLALFLRLCAGYLPRSTAVCLPGDPNSWRLIPCNEETEKTLISLFHKFSFRYLLVERRCGEWLRVSFRCTIALICIATGLCWLSRKFYLRDKLVILSYHRIDRGDDPLELNVAPRRFNAQMQYLRDHFNCIDLDAVANGLTGSRPFPGTAVAVTFDDGYRGDLPAMKRALSQHRIPSAIFVAPALLEDARLAWWETLAGIIRGAGVRGFRISAGEHGPHLDLKNRFVRRVCTRAIAERLRLMSPKERDGYLVRLAETIDIDPDTCVRPDLFLSWQELKALVEDTAVTVGSHTQMHRPVMETNETAFCEELRKSKEEISARIDIHVRHFAYPSGSAMRSNSERGGIFLSEDFLTAATNVTGVTDKTSNPYVLHRIGVADEPLPVFVAKVSGVFEMLKSLCAGTGHR